MYIESIINDYAERSDIGASSFQFLLNMADDYKNQLEMESIKGDIDSTNDDSLEINDLPF
jgi:hypothetical protein